MMIRGSQIKDLKYYKHVPQLASRRKDTQRPFHQFEQKRTLGLAPDACLTVVLLGFLGCLLK
jgi:hypothetical protein